jgi:murein DD-endopeptidase MepM/ murein hydrolase activator NlpD
MNDTWAWDFRMPSGIPIVAAGDGTVRLARGDSGTGGCDPSFAAASNYVVIAHPNGFETQYLHLETVVVAAGDQVKEGDLLGYSGKTGWACGSHLHFKVARAEGAGWNNPSVPSRIKGYSDPLVDSWVAAPQCTAARLLALEPKRSVDTAKVAAKPEPLNQPGVAQAKNAVSHSQTGSASPVSEQDTIIRETPAAGGTAGTRRAPRAKLTTGIGATE